ncbi:MAG: YebG family protein [Desulfosarcina sp.]|nr:YebG family protein [Desulfobacterales bacterium]
MSAISKSEADAHDRMLDAAEDLAALIVSGKVALDEHALDELTIFLARKAPAVRAILKGLRYVWP